MLTVYSSKAAQKCRMCHGLSGEPSLGQAAALSSRVKYTCEILIETEETARGGNGSQNSREQTTTVVETADSAFTFDRHLGTFAIRRA